MKPRRTLGSAILLSALLLAACDGTPTLTAQSEVSEPDEGAEAGPPEEAEAASDEVLSEQDETGGEAAAETMPLPNEGERFEFESEDGTVLVGSYWPGTESPSPGVILMHQYRASKEDWHSVVATLQHGPGYAVFAFDFRGHGESGGHRDDWKSMIGDSNAALAFFATLPGVDPQRIVMVGSSIGADAAVDSCGSGCIGSISLSPGSYLRMPYNEALLALNDKPVLCVASEDDFPDAKTCLDGVDAGLSDYLLQIYEGNTHGIAMFDITDQAPILTDLIMEWLAEHI